MEVVKLIKKSESIVKVLEELGANENVALAETTLKEFTQTNYDQLVTKDDYELLDKEVLDRIIREGLKVMVKIIDRAYIDAYYGHQEEEITI